MTDGSFTGVMRSRHRSRVLTTQSARRRAFRGRLLGHIYSNETGGLISVWPTAPSLEETTFNGSSFPNPVLLTAALGEVRP